MNSQVLLQIRWLGSLKAGVNSLSVFATIRTLSKFGPTDAQQSRLDMSLENIHLRRVLNLAYREAFTHILLPIALEAWEAPDVIDKPYTMKYSPIVLKALRHVVVQIHRHMRVGMQRMVRPREPIARLHHTAAQLHLSSTGGVTRHAASSRCHAPCVTRPPAQLEPRTTAVRNCSQAVALPMRRRRRRRFLRSIDFLPPVHARRRPISARAAGRGRSHQHR